MFFAGWVHRGQLEAIDYLKEIVLSDSNGCSPSLAKVNNNIDTSGDGLITVEEFAKAITTQASMSWGLWFTLMRVQRSGYRVEPELQKLIDHSEIYPLEAERKYQRLNDNNPRMSGDGRISSHREVREAAEREHARYRDPERLIVTAKVGVIVVAPEVAGVVAEIDPLPWTV